MKGLVNLWKIGLVMMLVSSSYAATKRYEIQSGTVEYSTSTQGSMMGITTTSKGSKKIAFKEWGNVEMIETDETTTTTMQGTEKRHSLTKFDNMNLYSVDEKNKIIIKNETFHDSYVQSNKNFTQYGRDMLKKNGGKLIGHEKILGYPCEVWEWNGAKIWVYKGVMLQVESSVMGVSTKETAIKAQFNTSIPTSRFALPKYPIKSASQMYENPGDGAEDGLSDQERQEANEIMKSLGNMFGR